MEALPASTTKERHRMNMVSRISRTQLLLIVLLIVSLIVATLFVIHAAMPGVWHTISARIVDGPNIPNWRP